MYAQWARVPRAVGVPKGACAEAPKAVFSRKWSKGTPLLDCNTYTAHLPFDLLPDFKFNTASQTQTQTHSDITP